MTVTPQRPGLVSELDGVSPYPKKCNERELRRLADAIYNRNIDDTFAQALVVSNMDNADGTVYTGATAEIYGFSTSAGNYEQYNAATASAAVITAYQSSAGLVLKPVAAGDNLEITNGTTSLSPACFTAGGGIRAMLEATIKITTVTSVTELWLGWRKAEAYQADPDDYDELACINVGLGASGRFNITTILNNAATSTTNTGLTAWTAGTTHTLRLILREDRQVEFWIDGTQSSVATYTFDANELVVPFLHLDTQTTDPVVSVSAWRCGKY